MDTETVVEILLLHRFLPSLAKCTCGWNWAMSAETPTHSEHVANKVVAALGAAVLLAHERAEAAEAQVVAVDAKAKDWEDEIDEQTRAREFGIAEGLRTAMQDVRNILGGDHEQGYDCPCGHTRLSHARSGWCGVCGTVCKASIDGSWRANPGDHEQPKPEPICLCPKGLIGSVAACPRHGQSLEQPKSETLP